jgi:serine/threonine protein kinase
MALQIQLQPQPTGIFFDSSNDILESLCKKRLIQRNADNTIFYCGSSSTIDNTCPPGSTKFKNKALPLFTNTQAILYKKLESILSSIKINDSLIDIATGKYIGAGSQGIAFSYGNFVVKLYKHDDMNTHETNGFVAEKKSMNTLYNNPVLANEILNHPAIPEIYLYLLLESNRNNEIDVIIKKSNNTTITDQPKIDAIKTQISTIKGCVSGKTTNLLSLTVMKKYEGDVDSLTHTPKFITDAAKIYIGVLSGLLFFKSKGLLHNDIKLENIFYTNDQYVLADFGSVVEYNLGNLNNVMNQFHLCFFGALESLPVFDRSNKAILESFLASLRNFNQESFNILKRINDIHNNEGIYLFKNHYEQIATLYAKLYGLVVPSDELFGEKYMNHLLSIVTNEAASFTMDKVDDIDRSINLSTLDTMKRPDLGNVTDKYVDLIKNVLNKVIFVNKTKFFTQYNSNLDRLVTLSRTTEIIFMTTNQNKSKSNFWLTMYSIKYLRDREVDLKYAYNILRNLLPGSSTDILDIGEGCENHKISRPEYEMIRQKIGTKPICIVFCDDISYSGGQLSGQLNGFCYDHQDGIPSFNIPEGVNIFLNLYGLTDAATARIKSAINSRDHGKLTIPSLIRLPDLKQIMQEIVYAIKGGTSVRHISNDDIISYISENDLFQIQPDNDQVIIQSLFAKKFFTHSNILDSLELALTYITFKYPDGTSIISNLCFVEKPIKCILTYDKYIKPSTYPDYHRINKKFTDNIKLIYQARNKQINLDSVVEYKPREKENVKLYFTTIPRMTYIPQPWPLWIIDLVLEPTMPIIITMNNFLHDKTDVEKLRIIQTDKRGDCNKVWDTYFGKFYATLNYNQQTNNMSDILADYKQSHPTEVFTGGGNSKLASYNKKYEYYISKCKKLKI